MKHIVSAQQFSKDELSNIFSTAEKIREQLSTFEGRKELQKSHQGRILATLFYEPSTRTRLSFESAAQRLGMGLISTENAGEFSSAIKGETIEDTIRVIDGYADIIVMRHKETGAAENAAAVSGVPIINAGDGKGEHPTQSLLDAYTIWRHFGKLSGLRIVLGGDLLHGRTARSLARVLSCYEDNHLIFNTVPELQMADDIKEYLKERNVVYEELSDMKQSFTGADVIYWTRLQKERLPEGINIDQTFVVDKKAMSYLSENSIVMHPLPRVDEIDASVDEDPRAKYFEQAENGLFIRMALLDRLLKN